jgi:hypothetical protein
LNGRLGGPSNVKPEAGLLYQLSYPGSHFFIKQSKIKVS